MFNITIWHKILIGQTRDHSIYLILDNLHNLCQYYFRGIICHKNYHLGLYFGFRYSNAFYMFNLGF